MRRYEINDGEWNRVKDLLPSDTLPHQGRPPKPNSLKAWECDYWHYKERHVVKCFFQKIKKFRWVSPLVMINLYSVLWVLFISLELWF